MDEKHKHLIEAWLKPILNEVKKTNGRVTHLEKYANDLDKKISEKTKENERKMNEWIWWLKGAAAAFSIMGGLILTVGGLFFKYFWGG